MVISMHCQAYTARLSLVAAHAHTINSACWLARRQVIELQQTIESKWIGSDGWMDGGNFICVFVGDNSTRHSTICPCIGVNWISIDWFHDSEWVCTHRGSQHGKMTCLLPIIFFIWNSIWSMKPNMPTHREFYRSYANSLLHFIHRYAKNSFLVSICDLGTFSVNREEFCDHRAKSWIFCEFAPMNRDRRRD